MACQRAEPFAGLYSLEPRPFTPEPEELGRSIAQMLGRLKLEGDIHLVPIQELLALQENKYDVILFGYTGSRATNYVNEFLCRDQSSLIRVGPCLPELDQAARKFIAEPSVANFQEFEFLLRVDKRLLPIYYTGEKHLLLKSFADAHRGHPFVLSQIAALR